MIEALKGKNRVLFEKVTKIVTYISSFFLISLTGIVIIGWLINEQALVNFDSNNISMAFSTAVCFIACALTLIFSLNNWMKTTRSILLFVFLVALLSLFANYLGGMTGGSSLSSNIITILNLNKPQNMVSTTAIFMMLSTVALFLATCNRHPKTCLEIASLISLIILGLSIIYLVAFVLNLGDKYVWNDDKPMAEKTMVSCIVLSLGILSLIWHVGSKRSIDVWKFMWLFVLIALLTGTALIVSEAQEEVSQYGGTSKLPTFIFIVGVIVAAIIASLFFLLHAAITLSLRQAQSLSLLRATLDSAADGIMAVDLQWNVLDYNKRFLQQFRMSAEEVKLLNRERMINIIKSIIENKDAVLDKMKLSALNPMIEINQELILNDGNVYEVYAKPQIVDGEAIGRVWSFRDITLQRRLEKQLVQLATHDALTDLPNRSMILKLLNNQINNQINNQAIAVVLVNINQFSKINDIYGRAVGDWVLKKVAHKLGELNAQLARISGDEFLMILNAKFEPEDIINFATKVLDAFAMPLDFFGVNVSISLCIGVSFWPLDGKDAEDLLSAADMAMLEAKEQGPNKYQIYSSKINVLAHTNMQIEANLRNAIELKQFIVHYQPILDLATEEVVAIEALVRWQHPERGLIYPKDFIYIAEQNNLINGISSIVIRDGCKQIKNWVELGCDDIKLAINISATQFVDDIILKELDVLLLTNRINSKQLEIELTESILIESTIDIKSKIAALKKRNISISIDDFGTGYSALSYLKNFDVDKLKIDYSFVHDCDKNRDARALIRAIVDLGKSMGLIVLAEGIETKEELEILKDLGCDQGQGFLFSKPLPADECLEYIKLHTTPKS